eukprot:jgi/Ulvmu1/8469/UM044_0002.1
MYAMRAGANRAVSSGNAAVPVTRTESTAHPAAASDAAAPPVDTCPGDPNKSSPGRCGCGVPETPTCGSPAPPQQPPSVPPPQLPPVPVPDPADGSAGVNAIGIAVDASNSLSQADFDDAVQQVIAYIDRFSSENSKTVFYISGFGSTVRDSTGAFVTNSNRRVSRLVLQRIVYRGGSTVNLAVVLDDFTARFSELSTPASATVVVLTGRTSSQTAVVAASRRLVSSFSIRVSIAAIGLTPRVSTTTLRSFVTTSGSAIAIAVDVSSAVSQAQLNTAITQLVSFVDGSSGVNSTAGVNRNIYYVSFFSGSIRGSTGVFLSNADRRVSLLLQRLSDSRSISRSGTTDLAVGLDDLTARYRDVSTAIPALAFVVAAGTSSRTAAVSAAGRLRTGFGGALSLACISLGDGANTGTLAAIASEGLGGEALLFESPFFTEIAQFLQRGLADADSDGDGAGDASDACPSDAAKTEAGRCGCGVAETPDCGDVPRCQSGLVIGISLDTSASVGSDDFETAQEQVITFIDATSGADTTDGANTNRYYVNSFNSAIGGTTGSFLSNVDRRVSRRVEADIIFRGGDTDIAAGIDDLIAEFAALPGTFAGVAIVITDGQSSRPEATTAANRLRQEGVTVASVAIGSSVDRPTLDAVASTGSDGEELVFETNSFEDISGILAAIFTRIDRDGDGVDDCRDRCPEDPNKTTPGRCGCGEPEATPCRTA